MSVHKPQYDRGMDERDHGCGKHPSSERFLAVRWEDCHSTVRQIDIDAKSAVQCGGHYQPDQGESNRFSRQALIFDPRVILGARVSILSFLFPGRPP
jgi:hypothetical protein